MAKGGEKEAKRQEDIARQNEESQNILNQFLAQLVPGSEEFNQLQSQGLALVRSTPGAGDQQDQIRQLGTQFVTQQQARVSGGGPATALEARTGKAFEELRGSAAFTPEEQAVFNALRGTPSTQRQTPSSTQDVFSQLVGRAQNPDAAFESTFQPQLQLLQDQVKSRAAQRGILGSGLELENLGRAGVELSIQQAQQREAFRQSQLQNFMNLFNVGQGLRGREIGVEEAFLDLQRGRETKLTDLLASQTFNRGTQLTDLFQRQTGRTEDLFDTAAQQEEERKAALGKMLGTALGAGAGFLIGGPPGAAIGSSIGGGGASALLGAQQAAPTSGTPRQLSSSLTRAPTPTGQLSPEELRRLLGLS